MGTTESDRQRLDEDRTTAERIAELETSLENARKDKEQTAQILQKACNDAASQRDAALKDRDKHAETAAVWRKRVHDAAEALADVLPGEVGRLNLLTRIQALKDAVAAAQQMLARLKPSGQVAEEYEAVRLLLGGASSPSLISLAAKAQGYEAAVAERDKAWSERAIAIAEKHSAVADNAALVDSFELMKWAVETNDPGLVPLLCLSIMKSPHPGAALLEQHRKEVAQARNEGLEEAALAMEETDGGYHGLAALIRAMKTSTPGPCRNALWGTSCPKCGTLIAMPTCTDGSCAKCRSGEPCR